MFTKMRGIDKITVRILKTLIKRDQPPFGYRHFKVFNAHEYAYLSPALGIAFVGSSGEDIPYLSMFRPNVCSH